MVRLLRVSGAIVTALSLLGAFAVPASADTHWGRSQPSVATNSTTPAAAQSWTFVDHFQYLSDCISAGENEAAPLGLQWTCVRDEPGYDLYVQ